MKRLNNFYIFSITILVASINYIQSMIKYRVLEPTPLKNESTYKGGICFANSSLQCLLQIPNFLKIAESKKYKELKAFIDCIKEYNSRKLDKEIPTKIPTAWPLVKNIYIKDSRYFGDTYLFIEKLIDILHCKNIEFRHKKLIVWGNIIQSNHIFNFKKISINEGFINPIRPIGAIKNQYRLELIFNAIPKLKTLIIRIQARIPEEFNKKELSNLIDDEGESFNHIWSNVLPKLEGRASFKLQSIIVLINIDMIGHAMSYINNNEIWWKCNDSNITKIGKIENVKDEIELNKELPAILFFKKI